MTEIHDNKLLRIQWRLILLEMCIQFIKYDNSISMTSLSTIFGCLHYQFRREFNFVKHYINENRQMEVKLRILE